MPERRQPTFQEQLAAWLLPIILGVLAYLLKTNYDEIKSQLADLKSQQQNAIVAVESVKMRLLIIEQQRAQSGTTGRGAAPPGDPAPGAR